MEGDTRKRLPLVGLFFAFVVTAVFLSTIILLFKDINFKSSRSEQPAMSNEIEESIVEEAGIGVITGSLGYPSENIPESLGVCAEEISTGKTVCTDNHIKDSSYQYGYGYRIEVPAGEYYVYAYVPNQPGATGGVYRAYYSEFVKCGYDVSCENHQPIRVVVNQGEVTEGVDPQDWYK
ncbi:MAG: hypothetical protein KatS3mg101_0687 [Patescibacteria group bacterium]|nr:MAG: hypothetical protein KatS3mg101_0687 [Patescibacteria group bacterium]